ncbi:hypothetical protein [Kitasatospora griseola]|uniref:hypothetical protein n=1 Tax=Kitasatospora griseola TaxID=2064 RepID=UPI00382D903E
MLWFRVRLPAGWDVTAGEVDLFTIRFVPEFTVVSLGGPMMTNTTVRGDGTVSTVAVRPEPDPLPGPVPPDPPGGLGTPGHEGTVLGA